MPETAIIKANGHGLQLTNLGEYQDFALTVCKSGMAPQSLDSPEKVLVALQIGAELGFTPMQSLNSIAVINGKPSIYGDAALALVRNSGLLESITETIEGTLTTALDKADGSVRATCKVKRKGEDPVERSFSVTEARMAGLWMKRGPWCTHPKRMLQYKARAFALRDVFPDVLTGLHCFEELQGETVYVESQEVTTSSHTLLEDENDGIRAEKQHVQPVPERAETGGEEGRGLDGVGPDRRGGGVGERLGQQEPEGDEVPERSDPPEAAAPERPASEPDVGRGDPILDDMPVCMCTSCGWAGEPNIKKIKGANKRQCPKCLKFTVDAYDEDAVAQAALGK